MSAGIVLADLMRELGWAVGLAVSLSGFRVGGRELAEFCASVVRLRLSAGIEAGTISPVAVREYEEFGRRFGVVMGGFFERERRSEIWQRSDRQQTLRRSGLR